MVRPSIWITAICESPLEIYHPAKWQVTSCTRLPSEHHAYPAGATWGLVMVLSGLVHNFEGAMAARFFLGVAEAGMSIELQCSVVR